MYELRLKIEDDNADFKWVKLGASDQLPKGSTRIVVVNTNGGKIAKLFGMAKHESSVYKFDFDKLIWNKKNGQSLSNGISSYSYRPFKTGSRDLVVAHYMGGGYGTYDTGKERVVLKRKSNSVGNFYCNCSFELKFITLKLNQDEDEFVL